MYIPEFNVVLNKQLDRDSFVEFFLAGDSNIKKAFPQIKSVDDVDSAIEYVYGHKDEHINKGFEILNKNLENLKSIAEIISSKIDCDWSGISKINITPCSFPVRPRFIESSTFLVTYYFDEPSIVGVCAHEMTHFLYFKKLKEGLNGGLVNTEYPSKDWLLSEIFVLFITNSDELRKITNYEDSLYITDDITVSNYQLDKIKDIYNKSDSLLNFRKLSLKVLE